MVVFKTVAHRAGMCRHCTKIRTSETISSILDIWSDARSALQRLDTLMSSEGEKGPRWTLDFSSGSGRP